MPVLYTVTLTDAEMTEVLASLGDRLDSLADAGMSAPATLTATHGRLARHAPDAPGDDPIIGLRLKRTEAAALHDFIATHVGVHHGHHTRNTITNVRDRVRDALQDTGWFS